MVLLGLATALALLAADIHAWQGTVARDDLRFRSRPSHRQLWQSPARLPGDPARAILGLGDALTYRADLQSFWLNEVGVQHGSDLSARRVATQERLQTLAANARTPVERSEAANLLGVMTITTTFTDSATLMQILARTTSYFRQAIADDPSNWSAKVNLELVLRLARPGKSKFGTDARGGFGFGGSQGAGVLGGGF